MKSVNPHNLESIAEYDELSEQELNDKLKLAASTFEKHRWSSYEERAQKLKKIAAELKSNTDKYAEMMTREMGKPIKEARSEAEKCAWVCEYYADNGAEFLKEDKIETDADRSYVSYEPLGVILAVMPWNFPFWQVFRFAAPTVMAGNTAVLKHASSVQGCAGLIEELFRQAGFEEGVFQNLAIHSDLVEKVIKNPAVKAVSLTGSLGAGASVAKLSGSEIKPSVLELGGSNSFIVLKDADLKKAAVLGTKARMINNAQSCIAAKRFLLHEDIADEFLKYFKEEMGKLKSGDPMKDDTEVGPMSSVDQAEELEEQVKKSLEKGAELVLGGKRKDAYFEPTIIANVKPGMPAFDEELFGPVASVISFKDEDEAVALNNKSQFGLGVSIITEDSERAVKMSAKIDDGAVFINELVKSDPRMPFGGTKKSGYGRELGRHGIHEFVNAKAVHVKKTLQ